MNKILDLREQQDLKFENVKSIVEELSEYDEVEFGDLSEINNDLFKKVVECCIKMFSIRKMQNKSYYSFDIPDLKRIKVDLENESFKESDLLKLNSFFNDNLELFYKLVSECFIAKKRSNNLEYELFFGKIRSPFSSGYIKIYLVMKNNNFYVIKNKRYDIDLLTYLYNYGINLSEQILVLYNKIFRECKNRFEIQKNLNEFFSEITSTIEKEHDFQEGAITFLDFLGWKGLWQKDNTKPLESVSRLIDAYREKLNEITNKYIYKDDNINNISELISISDTIAIFTPKILGINNKDLISIHSETVKYILETSCKEGFAIRGAISYGEYSIKNSIMIGPGIDECASWHEKCDWIGVHLTPSAQFIIINSDLPINVKSYNHIPVKHGIPKVKYCVDWKIDERDFETLRKKSKAILPEIAAKYMNTYDYLFGQKGEQ